MDLFIEVVLEFIAELILETSFEAFMNKKTPLPLRIMASVVVIAFFALLVFIAYGVLSMLAIPFINKDELAMKIIVGLALLIVVVVAAINLIVKRHRNKNRELDI